MLERISYDLVFDHKINKNIHTISPKSYEIKVKGKTIQFDFMDYIGTIDGNNPIILHVKHENLDTVSFMGAQKINATDLMFAIFTEFGIDVYAENESDIIIPTTVKNITFEFSTGIRIYASSEMLSSANIALEKSI